ncbi:SSI family serine proteinase inhibitor [Streptomyces sp. NPDC047108]|uniref:SSI family serine proteinase inhibitor n=1 Tax=Streptomyces sp. NPDC047108 TaxID=3155025 RepID=UPI0033F82EB5
MLLRRLALVTLSAAAAFAAAPAAGAAAAPTPHPVPLPVLRSFMPPPAVAPAGEDQLTITISNSGNRAVDGRYSLDCHPTGGTHRQARAACDRLDEMVRWGEDPFAPVEPRANCTMMYGGPGTARITGSWAGRPVDARFDRRNGCEIARWNRLRPVLPETGA